ncbi:MAG: hypothetical protein U9R50_08610 [Campylobacterota bacterium]|nr:hypothetical protein [Campylobacterota bacterium]
MKIFTTLAIVHVLSFALYAQEDRAEALVNSKEKADMTYYEMMQNMNQSASKVYDGIILENKIMVQDGAEEIMNHRAPNHKPWLIMPKSKQEAFKAMLLIYDEELHEAAEDIIDALKKDDWIHVNNAFATMTQSCIVCHSAWKNEVIQRNFNK